MSEKKLPETSIATTFLLMQKCQGECQVYRRKKNQSNWDVGKSRNGSLTDCISCFVAAIVGKGKPDQIPNQIRSLEQVV